MNLHVVWNMKHLSNMYYKCILNLLGHLWYFVCILLESNFCRFWYIGKRHCTGKHYICMINTAIVLSVLNTVAYFMHRMIWIANEWVELSLIQGYLGHYTINSVLCNHGCGSDYAKHISWRFASHILLFILKIYTHLWFPTLP